MKEEHSKGGNKSNSETSMDRNEAPPVLESEDKPVPLQNPTWSFIDTPEHLAALIACLNTRGFRECALRTALIELKSLLESILKECPSDMLCLPEDGGEEKARIQVSFHLILRMITIFSSPCPGHMGLS